MSSTNTNNVVDASKYMYLDFTHKFNDYNEIRNLNSYISNATSSDYERLNVINNNLKTRVLKLKQQYILYEHDASLYKFRTNLLYFVIVCMSLILFFIAMLSEGRIKPVLCVILLSIILVICVFVTIIYSISSKFRRNQAYNQFYWMQPNLQDVTANMAQSNELKKLTSQNSDTCKA